MSSNGRKFLSSGPFSFPVKITLNGIYRALPFKPVLAFIDFVQLSHVSYENGSAGIHSIAAAIKASGISYFSISIIISTVLNQFSISLKNSILC